MIENITRAEIYNVVRLNGLNSYIPLYYTYSAFNLRLKILLIKVYEIYNAEWLGEKKYGKKREKNSYFSLKLQHLIFHSFKAYILTERTKNIYVKRIWCFEMPKFTTSEDGVINDLTKKAGLNEDTLKRRNCVKREFKSFISS